MAGVVLWSVLVVGIVVGKETGKLSLPKWVYDLVMSLQEYEDTHEADKRVCLGRLLDKVPKEIRMVAEVIREYKEMESETDSEPEPETKPRCDRCQGNGHYLIQRPNGLGYHCWGCDGPSSGTWEFAGSACSAALNHEKKHAPSRGVGAGE